MRRVAPCFPTLTRPFAGSAAYSSPPIWPPQPQRGDAVHVLAGPANYPLRSVSFASAFATACVLQLDLARSEPGAGDCGSAPAAATFGRPSQRRSAATPADPHFGCHTCAYAYDPWHCGTTRLTMFNTHKSIITLVKNRILEVFLLLQPARLCVGQLQGSVCSCCPGFSSAALFGRLCCRHGGGTNAWCRKANWTRMHQGRNGCGAAHVAECTLGHSSEDAQNANNARTHGRGAWHV